VVRTNKTLQQAKKLVVSVIGATILIIGLVMLVMPGPGFLVIIIGLGILATEFVWANLLLEKAKNHYEKTKQKINNRSSGGKLNKERNFNGRTN
jgi:uncharacterized protein (TIGR02611 family)